MGVGNRLLQLEGNRLRIWRTIPAVVNRARHAPGIAAGERILRLSEGADVHSANGARFAENLLGQRNRRHDLIVFAAAGGKNPANMHLPAQDRYLVASLGREARRQLLSE